MAEESFTVLELISQSPTTSVYKAYQNALGRTVLLKILHKHLLKDKELVARFSREARACAMLHSENIVQVYDLTEIDGKLSIVMEFIDGRTLADLLSGEFDRTEDFLVKLASSVLNALAYAHERGVIHRDIKPSNILISDNGVIKVTDFGLATVTDTPSLTIDGSLIGTPAYMSPEQARGEPVDLRTDLFSLGVTLVEVLSGEKIFAGQSYTECIGKIQSFDIDSLESLAARCSASFFSFLKGLLAPDRDQRFRSAHEALDALNKLGETPSLLVASPARKKKRMSYVFGAGAAGILMAVVWYISFMPKTPVGKMVTGSVSPPNQNQRSSVTQEVGQDKDRIGKSAIGAISRNRRSTTEDEAQHSKQADDSLANVPQSSPATSVASKSDSGYIAVSCVPWAHVYIDSEYAGMTPIMGSIEVPTGNHTIIFSNPVFAPLVEQVKVKPKLLTNVKVNFYKSSGLLYVSVNPWGKVYVDDQLRETTPSDSAIIVAAGAHRIRIDNPYYSSITKSLNVKPGDTLRLNFSFRPDGTR